MVMSLFSFREFYDTLEAMMVEVALQGWQPLSFHYLYVNVLVSILKKSLHR